jgi:hypothetical protein
MVSRLSIGIVFLAAALASGAETPPVVVPAVANPPVIDCALEDEAWSQAATLAGFRQIHPGDNTEPSHPTQVRLAYTPQALYVAILADDEPGRVRATLARRDAIGDDDTVSLYLDTFHDRRRAYVVMVNPLGIQQDGVMVDGSEPDFSVDLVMQSAGCLRSRGYSVEIAIPFESLRYQAGAGRTWGLHVLRQIKHLDEENSWMPLRRDRIGVDRTSTKELRARFLAQGGRITGLEGLRVARLLEWIPVATGSHATDSVDLGLGATARLTVSPSVAIDVAANPDFAELEADQPQVTANQRFPLFFAEKRPFFLEGADLFQTPVRAFHSRSIVEPDGALKVTGTRGRTSGSAIFAMDAAPGRFSEEEREDPALAPSIAPLLGRRAHAGAVRLRRDVGEQSSLGFLGTTYHFAGRRNQVAGLDGRLALGPRTTWTFQVLGSTSRLPYFEPRTGETPLRSGHGLAYFSELARTGSRVSIQIAGEGHSRDHRAALGYTQRTDTNRWSAFVRYNAPPSGSGPLVSWSAVNTTLAQFDWHGRMQYAYTYPRLLLAFKRQTFLNLSAYQDYVRVFEEEFGASRSPSRPGAFAGPSAERSIAYHGFTIDAGTAPSQTLSLSATYDQSWNVMDYDLGAGPRFPRVSPLAVEDPNAPLDPGPGWSRYVMGALAVQPTPALRLTAHYEWTRLTRSDTRLVAFDQDLLSLRLQYAFSRFTSLRGRLDYDSLDGRMFQQFVFGWTPRPGTAVYLGHDETGHWNEDRRDRPPAAGYTRRDRTFFAKISWARRNRL